MRLSAQLVQVAVVPALGGAHRRHSRYDALYHSPNLFFSFLFRSLPLGLTGQRAPLSAPRCLPASPDAAPHRAETQWVRCSTLPHGSRAGFAACALAQWPLPRPPSVWYSAHLFSPFKRASCSSTSSQLCGCDFHLPLQTSGRELSYLRSVRASKDIHRGIDSAIHLGLAKLTCPVV